MTPKQRARRARDLAVSQAMGRPGASLRAVARAFGMSPATVGRSLDRVRESGRVILSQPSRDRRVAA